MIFEFKGYKPVIHETAYIHPQASVIGNVIIGKNVYVGACAVIRGDIGEIIIDDGSNVQENCVLHMFPGISVHLYKNSHIGHGAIIHGAKIYENALVGMNSVVMDKAIVGKGSIIGAMSFVPEGMRIPDKKVYFGNPAKEIKDVTDEMLQWKIQGTQLYQTITNECHLSLKRCDPLREIPPDRIKQDESIKTWNELKKSSL